MSVQNDPLSLEERIKNSMEYRMRELSFEPFDQYTRLTWINNVFIDLQEIGCNKSCKIYCEIKNSKRFEGKVKYKNKEIVIFLN